MSITTVLFDLDGTLLPMDQDVFIKDYFGRLAKKLVPYGYEPKKLIETVWAGTKAMVKNTGEKIMKQFSGKLFLPVMDALQARMPRYIWNFIEMNLMRQGLSAVLNLWQQ